MLTIVCGVRKEICAPELNCDDFVLREVPSGKLEPSGRASTSASDSSRQVSRQVKIFFQMKIWMFHKDLFT